MFCHLNNQHVVKQQYNTVNTVLLSLTALFSFLIKYGTALTKSLFNIICKSMFIVHENFCIRTENVHKPETIMCEHTYAVHFI